MCNKIWMFLYYYHHPHHHPLGPKRKFAPSLRVCWFWFWMPLGLQLHLLCRILLLLLLELHSTHGRPDQFLWLVPLTGAPLPLGWLNSSGRKKRSNIWQCRSDVAKNRTTLLLLLFLLFLLLLRQRQTASISKPSHSFIHSCLGSWDWDCSTSSSSSCAAQNVQKSPDWFSMPLRYRPRNWVLLGICLLLYL